MKDAVITFFMIVTDRDIVIADYTVRSYDKIKDIPFKLLIYSNWVSSHLKQKYFGLWKKNLSYVEIIENNHHTEDKRPTDRSLTGPFEYCDPIWDRELPKIQTLYHATVDADFEILDAEFVSVMINRLNNSHKLIAMSVDYNPKIPKYYESYTKEIICINERWHTCFCIYKREALKCNVSHSYHQELTPGPIRRNAWDSSAYFQKVLKDVYGFELCAIESEYQPCFIHYGAFVQNTVINKSNVAIYRGLQIIRKNGIFKNSKIYLAALNKLIKKMADFVNIALFGNVDRSKFADGWGVKNRISIS